MIAAVITNNPAGIKNKGLKGSSLARKIAPVTPKSVTATGPTQHNPTKAATVLSKAELVAALLAVKDMFFPTRNSRYPLVSVGMEPCRMSNKHNNLLYAVSKPFHRICSHRNTGKHWLASPHIQRDRTSDKQCLKTVLQHYSCNEDSHSSILVIRDTGQ